MKSYIIEFEAAVYTMIVSAKNKKEATEMAWYEYDNESLDRRVTIKSIKEIHGQKTKRKNL